MKRSAAVKITSLFLSSLLLLSSVSCTKSEKDRTGENEEASGEQTNTHERIDYSLYLSLPDVDENGKTLTFATAYPERIAPSESGSILDAALLMRNRMIEEKYNVEITAKTADAATAQLFVQSSLLSGESYADILYYPQKNIANMGCRGLLLNINSIPFLKLDAPYYNSAELKEFSVLKRDYGLYGCAALEEQYYNVVFFNKSIISELGLESPYTLYRNGLWTWDKYLELANAAKGDLDGNKRITASADRYGHSGYISESDYIDNVFSSLGLSYFSKDEDGLPFMDYKNDAFSSVLALIKKVCKTDASLYPVRNAGSDVYEVFAQGRLLFLVGELTSAAELYGKDVDFGIVPLPTDVAGKENLCPVNDDICGFAVPINNSDTEFTGLMLNALYASSYYALSGKLYDTFVTYYLRDNDSALILRDIMQKPKYELAYAYGDGMPEFASASYELLRSVINKNLNFNTLYSQNSKVFRDYIESEFIK